MGRPRRKPPSPGRQWFVARRFPTLAASSFQPPFMVSRRHPGADTLAMLSQKRKRRADRAAQNWTVSAFALKRLDNREKA